MQAFLTSLLPIYRSIVLWVTSISTTIRSNPFLLFTLGFVALGYVVIVLGRILSRE